MKLLAWFFVNCSSLEEVSFKGEGRGFGEEYVNSISFVAAITSALLVGLSVSIISSTVISLIYFVVVENEDSGIFEVRMKFSSSNPLQMFYILLNHF